MPSEQPITSSLGIHVFGSAIIRVLPDVVVIRFSVSQVEQHPKAAFEAVRESAQKLQAYLNSAQIKDAGSSRVSLNEDYRYINNENKFMGYRTSVEFRVLMTDLARVEEILAGIVDVGANKIISVDFQTTKLKELRAEARRQAVAAAREKAEIYCKAAGIEVGEVMDIEDVNPTQLGGREGHDIREQNPSDDGADTQAFDPSSIIVGGAVKIIYKIQGR